MSRGFDTLGVGTSDEIDTNCTIDCTGSSTRAMWCYVKSTVGNTARIYTKFKTQITVGADQIYLAAANNFSYARIFTSATAQWSASITYPLNTWFHLALSYDASNTTNVPVIYFNGVATTMGVLVAPVGTITTTTDPFVIGTNGFTPTTRVFDGLLAHFSIWNGVLLTQGEIAALANGANPATIRPDRLICYLPLDGINNPEPDLINGNSASISGTRLGISEPPVEPLYPEDDIFAEIIGFPAFVSINSWYPTYDPQVTPGMPAIQYSAIAAKIQPSPIAQNKFYPTYDASVKAPLAAPPSIIGWNVPTVAAVFSPIKWYPGYDPTVVPGQLFAQYSRVWQSLPTPINMLPWLPDYAPEVKPGSLAAKYSQFSELLGPPITITGWYPTYDATVKPKPLSAQFSQWPNKIQPSPIAQNDWMPSYDPKAPLLPVAPPSVIGWKVPTISITVTINSWYPGYDPGIKPGQLAAQYSLVAQLLPNPVAITKWYPAYEAQVKGGPLGARFTNYDFRAPRRAPIAWYPSYEARVYPAPTLQPPEERIVVFPVGPAPFRKPYYVMPPTYTWQGATPPVEFTPIDEVEDLSGAGPKDFSVSPIPTKFSR